MKIPVLGKLVGLVSASVLLTACALGWVAINKSSEALESVEVKALEGVSLSRRDALASYLESIKQDLATVASNPYTAEALTAFSNGWDELGAGQMTTLQNLYIEDNPNPLGEKEKLDYAPDGSSYSAAHQTYHDWFREFLRARGYYDIFLIRNDGELIYSVFKELDYATNLATGEYATSDLGNAYSTAMNLGRGDMSFFDFKPYAPSHGAPASFISTPLFDASGQRIGALVFQMPIDRINATLGSSAGLGETGESYLVGTDGYLRSQAPKSDEATILKAKVSKTLVRGATSQNTSLYEGMTYGDHPVVATAAKLSFEGVDWFVVAQIDQDELLIPTNETKSSIFVLGAIMMLVVSLISAFVAHRIARPIKNIAAATQRIISGEMQTVVPHQNQNDELGPLAQAIDKFRTETLRFTEEFKINHRAAEEAREEAERRAENGQKLIESAKHFDELMTKTLASFSEATTNLDNQAHSMSAIAEETASQSSEIANASSTASNNVRNVAAATEELSVSVQEISGKMEVSRNATERAVEQSEIMRERVSGMETAANAISEVLELITGIASQTNLLALNATIEAARAGEAGKGFAVVASEVKELANQTSKATEDISRQISQIQETTASSVSGIADIMSVISELESISLEVANSIEQQSHATNQISQSIQEAAGSVSEVDGNIGGVTEAANETGKSASEIQNASASLAEQSSLIKEEVESFLKTVRAS